MRDLLKTGNEFVSTLSEGSSWERWMDGLGLRLDFVKPRFTVSFTTPQTFDSTFQPKHSLSVSVFFLEHNFPGQMNCCPRPRPGEISSLLGSLIFTRLCHTQDQISSHDVSFAGPNSVCLCIVEIGEEGNQAVKRA